MDTARSDADTWTLAQEEDPSPGGKECGIYPARPLTCRGWNSYDANACESAYRQGPDRVVVPVNQRLRMVHPSAGARLARAFLDDALQGHVYRAAVLYQLMDNESVEAFTQHWLEGAIEV